MNPIYEQIEARYNFRLPAEYCELDQLGRIGYRPGVDRIIFETEWMPPETIRDHIFQDYELPNFVPFAFNFVGDHWCWWPEQETEQGIPVVMCPHDEGTATVCAASFLGFLYREALEQAHCRTVEDEEMLRHDLHDWCQNFSSSLPPMWAKTLAVLETKPFVRWQEEPWPRYGLLNAQELDFLIQRDLMFPRFDEKIMWMKP